MRSWFLFVVCTLLGCAQPTLLSCPADQLPCADGCYDLQTELAHCGACGNACPGGMTCTLGTCRPSAADVCATNNGGCSPDAMCFDMNGTAACACHPDFTGDGHTCAACTVCTATEFIGAPCNPIADTVCTTCSGACTGNSFESQPCGATADRMCTACTVCPPGGYEAVPCGATTDAQCAPCAGNCATCTGASDFCTSCGLGFQLVGASCVPSCGNGVLDPGEMCDDGNLVDGDGCAATCLEEVGFYCFGVAPSRCLAGGCSFEPATALPLGPAFAIDGVATVSAAGAAFSQRSSLYTTADASYPMMIEADVIYSAAGTTFIGTRGSGLRQHADADEPTDALRARLSASVQLAAGPTILTSAPTPFTPALGVPYHLQFFDDGVTATVSWIDETNPANAITLITSSTYHGGGDRAFIAGGGGLTVANVRVCAAPPIPVTAGLVARYSAIPSWTALTDATGPGPVTTWQDVSTHGHTLSVNGPSPVFAPGLINGHAALDFGGGARLSSVPFTLTTDVTVFAVMQHNATGQWGTIAHHGSRDLDWSMEQSGGLGNNDKLHWQTNNDSTNLDLLLVQGTRYVLTGRIAGLARYFSSATFDGLAPVEASIVDTSSSITTGVKALYVGTSDVGEASNAYIGDLVYFDRALSDVERDLVIDYLRRLWRF